MLRRQADDARRSIDQAKRSSRTGDSGSGAQAGAGGSCAVPCSARVTGSPRSRSTTPDGVGPPGGGGAIVALPLAVGHLAALLTTGSWPRYHRRDAPGIMGRFHQPRRPRARLGPGEHRGAASWPRRLVGHVRLRRTRRRSRRGPGVGDGPAPGAPILPVGGTGGAAAVVGAAEGRRPARARDQRRPPDRRPRPPQRARGGTCALGQVERADRPRSPRLARTRPGGLHQGPPDRRDDRLA